MTPKPADAPAVSEIYELLRYAATRKLPIAATYDGQPDCFALMLVDESQADCTCFAISLEEVAIVPNYWRQKARVYGVASL